jgi:cyclophilin family peptidyl-prolyl cis-trans isomerase
MKLQSCIGSIFSGRTICRSKDAHGAADRTGEPMFESLERRALMSDAPFPVLGDLVNANNTVVRLDTNFGDIFFELYDVAGPNGAPAATNTVDNFLGYIERGDYDESFLHRLSFNAGDVPFVLQGGGFRFLDGVGISNIPQQASIANEFHPGRSNIERSIAMAKLGGQPNSATNNFFINLSDNAANLDNQNGGFTVFGRVANDASWTVVLDIQDQERRAFNNLGGAFSDVPVTDDFNPTVGPSEATLVTLQDVEVVKARNVSDFYTLRFFYPEGFAGSTINEFLPLGNNTGEVVHYQVIARAETAQGTPQNGFTWFRDRVLESGSIGPNARGGTTISQFGSDGAPGAGDLVPQGVPYAIEVWATRSLSANISHYDFGTSTGEAFTGITSTTWSFGEGEKTSGVADFLVWENANEVPANIDVTFYFANQAPVTVPVRTDMFRRGGLSLGELPQIPNNSIFSIRMVSDQPITAALTHFDQRSASDPLGSATLGIPGEASQFAVLPLANAGANVTDTISVFNPGSTSAVVNLTLSFADPNLGDIERPAAMIIPANSRQTFNMANIAQVADGRRYSIRINSNAAIHAGWLHSQAFPGISNRDAVSNPISNSASTAWRFAEGFMDPGRAGVDIFETLAVYNPNSLFFTGENTTANVTFRFRYGDGFTVTETRQVTAGRRLDIDVHALQSVLNEGLNNERFFYTVEIESDIPVVAQMWHFDLTLGALQPSGGFSTLGSPGTLVRLDSLNDGG